jgi:hypothetical protein
MITQPRIVTNHCLIFRDGDALTVNGLGPNNAVVATPANAGRNVQPAAADASWLDVGIISSLGVTHDRTEVEIYAPSPGQFRLYDILETKRKLGVKFECAELSAFIMELIFGLTPMAPATLNYNPLSGVTKKVWLQIQQYDHTDTLVNTCYLYCQIKVEGELKFDDANVKAAISAMVLHTVLNSGTLIAN